MQPNVVTPLDSTVIAALIALLSAVIIFFWRKCLDRRSINKAILSEIKRLLEVVTVHRDWWERLVRAKDTGYPLIPFSHAVYATQVKNIGELKGSVVVRAVKFYGSLDFINALQAARPLYDPKIITKNGPLLDVFNIQYLGVLNSFVEKFEKAFEKEFDDLA